MTTFDIELRVHGVEKIRKRLRRASRTRGGKLREAVTVKGYEIDVLLYELDNAELNGIAMVWIREAAMRVLGGNYTFADDDLQAIELLAIEAVKAGLTSGLIAPEVEQKARVLHKATGRFRRVA